ncbi:hypothetical protein QQF64_036151, partial [Cirrhinus molitorella]
LKSTKKLNIVRDTFQACGRGGTSWSTMYKDLAVAVFGRSMSATHNLSGKTGNANKKIANQASFGSYNSGTYC